ncbi:MAG: zinc-dependent peptidase [Flavipsychrobacter sp.]|nr:zinc-dependent peptidase [Flavipsychrobacter sp.]
MWALALLILAIAAVTGGSIIRRRRIKNFKLPATTHDYLLEHVAFYKALTDDKRLQFDERVRDFLARTAVTGIGIEITETDKVLVAASAIIPIFSFPDWRYNNISEVLLYKGTFDKEYHTKGGERNVLGMVGNGAMQGQMILSLPALRAGFSNPVDGNNTAIHEFAHLIDKADGSTDGVPEYLLKPEHIEPWLKYMHQNIEEIRKSRHSDINPYGATNEAEFFAVMSEYFFERPQDLQKRHPELYALLDEMFNPTKEDTAV